MKKSLVLALMTVVFVMCFSVVGIAQNVCSKQTGDSMKIYIRNATDKAFTVNYVDGDCKESPSDEKIEPGKAFTGDVTGGDAFRVREAGTNNVIQTVVANPSDTTTTIGVVKNSDPRQSFIQTLNQIRRGRNLPEIELNDSLTKGCQWFAELMAKFDKGGHDAVLIGGNSYKDMQNPWDRSKKMGYVGDGGTEATSEGDVTDLMTLGGDSMIGWASSSTHYRPFLAMDGQMFKQVGFGYAKSAKKPNYYYTCAVFGNPDEKADNGGGNNNGGNNNADNNQSNDKEPVKTDVPDGLKFNESKFFVMENGAEKYGTSFAKSSFDELNAIFSFDNPSSQPFNVEVRSYLNGKVIGSESMKDLKGSGAMSVRVAGEGGQTGKVASGKYRFEVLLNGEVVLSAEATVK